MKKKEFAVGEVFQFGLMKLKVVKQDEYLSCYDCDLSELCERLEFPSMGRLVGQCEDKRRTDRKNVIFVELEDKQ